MVNRYRPWLLLLFSAPYFLHLGASSIWDINEAFYVEAPREMMQAGDFLTPRFNYHFRFEKPILSYWVILPFYYLLGPGELAARLPGALCMVLTLIVVYRMGRLLFDRTAGLFGALVLATSFKVFWLARRSIIDMLLLLCVTAAVYFAIAALRSENRARLYAGLFYVAMALGTLAKGLLGLLLPCAIIALYWLGDRDFASIRRLHPLRGLVLYLAIGAPWYVAMVFKHGWGYIQFFFGGNHMDRYLYGSYSIARPIWFYVPTFFGGFFPWSLFLLPAILYGYRAYRRRDLAERRALRLLLVWFAFIFVFFSLARAKQEEYILQLYPASALAVGFYFSRLRAPESAAAPASRGALVFSIGLAVAAFGLFSVLYYYTAVRLFGPRYFFNGIPTLGLTLAAVLLACMLVLKRDGTIFPITAGATLFFLLCLTGVILPDCERYRPVRALAARIVAESRPKDAVGSYRVSLPSLCFYTGRQIFEVTDPPAIEAILCGSQRAFCLMEEQDFGSLRQSGKCRLYVLESRPKLVTTLKGFQHFWRSGQLPHLLLVSNQSLLSD